MFHVKVAGNIIPDTNENMGHFLSLYILIVRGLMINLQSLVDNKHAGVNILMVFFIMYIIFGWEIPPSIAALVDTIYGKIAVLMIAIALFLHNVPLGILAFIVAYHLTTNSSIIMGTNYELYDPNYRRVKQQSDKFGHHHKVHFPFTLEQEIIKKSMPRTSIDTAAKVGFKPLVSNLNGAQKINDSYKLIV